MPKKSNSSRIRHKRRTRRAQRRTKKRSKRRASKRRVSKRRVSKRRVSKRRVSKRRVSKRRRPRRRTTKSVVRRTTKNRRGGNGGLRVTNKTLSGMYRKDDFGREKNKRRDIIYAYLDVKNESASADYIFESITKGGTKLSKKAGDWYYKSGSALEDILKFAQSQRCNPKQGRAFDHMSELNYTYKHLEGGNEAKKKKLIQLIQDNCNFV